MNWLAHLLLSEPTPEFRLGNILPDFLPLTELRPFTGDFQRGIECHRQIDAFTDRHPLVRRSKQRIAPPLHKHAGILVDIFYDHVLTREWQRYSPSPARDLIDTFYTSFDSHRAHLPETALAPFHAMREQDWLGSYGDAQGVRSILQRLSRRLRRPVDLASSVVTLEREYTGFAGDFHAFFPELKEHVARVTRPAHSQSGT